MPRDGKKTSPPDGREPARGLAALVLEQSETMAAAEPAFSTRPTRRDVQRPDANALRAPRGEVRVGSAEGQPSNEASGTIGGTRDTKPPATRSRRRSGSPDRDVHLAAATRREITVIVRGEPVTLERDEALALAAIITTTFD